MITDHRERASIKLTSPPRLQCIQSSRKIKICMCFSFFFSSICLFYEEGNLPKPRLLFNHGDVKPRLLLLLLTLPFSRLSPTNLSIHLGLTALDQFVSRRGETGIGEKSQWKLLIREGGMKRRRRHSANFPNACYRCDSGLGGKA